VLEGQLVPAPSRLPLRELKCGSDDFGERFLIVVLKHHNWSGEIKKLIASGEPGLSYRRIVCVDNESCGLKSGSEGLGTLRLAITAYPFLHATGVLDPTHGRRTLEAENFNQFRRDGVDPEAGDLVKPVVPNWAVVGWKKQLHALNITPWRTE
jgi:hypothetical protein